MHEFPVFHCHEVILQSFDVPLQSGLPLMALAAQGLQVKGGVFQLGADPPADDMIHDFPLAHDIILVA